MQNDVVKRLTTVEKKVWLVEEGVQPQVDNRQEEQKRKIQKRLYHFEWMVTRQLKGGQTSDIAGVKAEVAKLQNLINKVCKRPIFPMPVIAQVQPKVEIENIQGVAVGEE